MGGSLDAVRGAGAGIATFALQNPSVVSRLKEMGLSEEAIAALTEAPETQTAQAAAVIVPLILTEGGSLRGQLAAGARALTASDLGLSGKGIAKLVGTVTDAGGTRILNVGNIEAVSRGALVGQLRGALPNILSAARAGGVQTLQITGTFANPGLQQFAASQAGQYGGTFSSAGGVEALTFILR